MILGKSTINVVWQDGFVHSSEAIVATGRITLHVAYDIVSEKRIPLFS